MNKSVWLKKRTSEGTKDLCIYASNTYTDKKNIVDFIPFEHSHSLTHRHMHKMDGRDLLRMNSACN